MKITPELDKELSRVEALLEKFNTYHGPGGRFTSGPGGGGGVHMAPDTGGGSGGGGGESEFNATASLKQCKLDLKKAGYSRLKAEKAGSKDVIRFPKNVTSNIEVGQRLQKQGWTSVNREAAINRQNKVTYLTKGKLGIEVNAGSTMWKEGASVWAWEPRADEAPRLAM